MLSSQEFRDFSHERFNGALIMIVTQMLMVAIMTMTPIHMRGHGHQLNTVGIVIGIHVGAMYLPSLLTGSLVARIGAIKMGMASGITLCLAAFFALFSPPESTVLLSVALALLGLGWNFGLISGTTMIVDATDISNRAKIQGTIDVFVALSGSLGGILSGVIVGKFTYGTLGLFGMILSVLLTTYLLIAFMKKDIR